MDKAKKEEPILGVKNIRLIKKKSKIKAFVDVIVPTSEFGDILIRNFKVVEGTNGLFVSLPNHAVTVKGGRVIDEDGKTIRTQEDQTRYYNDIRFENQERYKQFRDVLDGVILPALEDRLKKAVPVKA